ncbi:DNA mismatch repair protein MutS [Cytophagaceae bacterium YF14B1]|uniref:DNA mismatch repair protein MutS n=1 Tax=Xanthocytophaga flava TaxID=3048013 RepID=A0AAE3QPP4_9BACT|nr:DNA mismatch repair protein MutS [Xanthocytophaga flavus]MDJ1483172.1 DNA mismatch repair protein MutS [Xanthocytophaga flavus]
MKTEETPLMKQYNQFKVKYPGALLLFRVGDFYETFGDDAIKTSKILDIVLTKRSNGAASEVPLAGFPHHALEGYLAKLVRAGQRVAICDQLEDPKYAKGLVKRGVTELVTPGVAFSDNVLDTKRNNYLSAVYFAKDAVGVAFLDASTGEFFTTQGDLNYIEKLLQGFLPAEILYCKPQKNQFFEAFGDKYITYALEDWVFTHDHGYNTLTQHFKTTSLKGFGIENLSEGIVAAGSVLHYLAEAEHKNLKHIAHIARLDEERYVWLDKFTIRNLELVHPQQEGGVPLIQVLDQTVTPMGSRLMRKWLVLPLKEKKLIEERLEVVSEFVQNEDLQEEILKHMKAVGDIERLISRVAVRRANPRDLCQLKKSLTQISPIKDWLANSELPQLKRLADRLHPCLPLVERLEKELREDAPAITNQGGMLKEGVNAELDELHKLAFSGKDYLLQIQQREIAATGITSLKVSYNKVFGYYLEVSNAHKHKVPNTWLRKQTLVNAERYITEELKVYEEKILNAEDQIFQIEQQLFNELVLAASEYTAQIQQNAFGLAMLDCLLSFARVAIKNRYVRPQIRDNKEVNIKEGRHPVIEQQLPLGESYVPNSILLNDETQQIIVITGPNMAGKSALLRQTALIVLMAQMGSFVPAEEATIGLVDKVFTRVGASDNLSRGESTFMVEMTETASILNNLSERSLVLMDEIGRGTSTYDGISIAWSIVEYLHNHPKYKAKTLFATHYHELNQLAEDFPRIRNYNVSVKEVGNKVVFLRKLKEGGSEHSFGIHVAQMAGMPQNVVLRANEIMHHLETDKIRQQAEERVREVPKNNVQFTLFEADPTLQRVADTLEKVDVNTLTPIEALLKLNELKSILNKKN